MFLMSEDKVIKTPPFCETQRFHLQVEVQLVFCCRRVEVTSR